ncbi:MAG: hypothetical protein ACJ784_10270, partial [Myxococcales bacterium]
VLPVIGLGFTGLSSGTLTLFSTLSRISIAVVLVAMSIAVLWLGWRVGGLPRTMKIERGTPSPSPRTA